MYAVAVVVLNALSFASLAYIANGKGYHAISAGGGSMAVWRGQRVADFGLALMSRRFLPPGTFEEPESRLPVQARRIRMDERPYCRAAPDRPRIALTENRSWRGMKTCWMPSRWRRKSADGEASSGATCWL